MRATICNVNPEPNLDPNPKLNPRLAQWSNFGCCTSSCILGYREVSERVDLRLIGVKVRVMIRIKVRVREEAKVCSNL